MRCPQQTRRKIYTTCHSGVPGYAVDPLIHHTIRVSRYFLLLFLHGHHDRTMMYENFD